MKPDPHRPLNRDDFKNPALTYTVTSRDIVSYLSVWEYIKLLFSFIDLNQVESLFGFTSCFSPLYGGREFSRKHVLAKHHLAEMETLGIHLSLNLTNHFFSEDAWQATLPLLEKHHRPGNGIICVNDRLARRIRAAFPAYTLKASIIKNLNTTAKVRRALDLYDQVVIPMEKNDDAAFLEALPHKSRLILFGIAACAYTCPRRTCYLEVSQLMQGRKVTGGCSQAAIPRPHLGKVYFDVKRLHAMGFERFKLIPTETLPEKKRLIAGFQEHKTWGFFSRARRQNFLSLVASYPKSGRTWLRFFMANYFVLLKKLDMKVDLESMFTLFPNHTEGDRKRGREAFNVLFRNDMPLICFSHAPYSADLKGQKILMLLRSPPDTLVSEYFHFTRHLKTDHGPMAGYLFGGKHQGVHRLIDYLNSWAEMYGKPGFEVVSYEAMHRTPVETFAKVLRFFDIEIDDRLLRKAIQMSDFEQMAGQEAQRPIPGQVFADHDPEARRMRKGRIGGHRAYLSDDQLEKLRDVLATGLSPAARTLLKTYT